jgi:hypothetical protein
MPITPATDSFDDSFPDPHTYTVVINEFQRALIAKMINYGIASLRETQWLDKGEEAMALALKDMLDPEGSTGPLAISPCVNSFVL